MGRLEFREFPDIEKPVSVCICSYDRINTTTVHDYIRLVAMSPHIWEFTSLEGSILPMCRNYALRNCSVDKETGKFLSDYILFIDDDMIGFMPEHLHRMIAHDVDMVGCTAIMRKPPHKICAKFQNEDMFKAFYAELRKNTEDRKIIEVESIGFGFTLIRSQILEDLVELTPREPIWFNLDRPPRDNIMEEFEEKYAEWDGEDPKQMAMDMLAFGANAAIGADIYGEDFSFCLRAAMKGYKIYIDPGICLGHRGVKTYTLKDCLEWYKTTDSSQLLSQVQEDQVLASLPTF